MPIEFKHQEEKALERYDNISATRALYLEKQQCVEITFEMDDERAWDLFNKLPSYILPVLPHGYQWVEANHNFSVIRNISSKEHDIKVVLYGPDKTNYINFICQVDGITTYSFAHTKHGKGPDNRAYPISSNNYRVLDYNYAPKKYGAHVRGHLIDHQDTILGKPNLSTCDARNYVPEPPEYEWGLGFRRLKIAELRKTPGGGAYAQMNMYSEASWITANGTSVPDDVRVYTYTKNNHYQAKEVYHVDFEENMQRPKGVKVLEHAASNFASSVAASPVVSIYSPDWSDRSLRASGREAFMKENKIGTHAAPSRFVYKDKIFSASSAGDKEFETAGRQLHTGVFATEDDRLSLEYIKRAMFFGDDLLDLDGAGTVFSSEEKKEGGLFFKSKGGDMEDFYDHFKQLSRPRSTA